MIDWKEISKEIRQQLPDLKLLEEEPLGKHTSFRIGGPAALMAMPATKVELATLLRFVAARGITPYLLGAGTNVLAPDDGLRALSENAQLLSCMTGLTVTDDAVILECMVTCIEDIAEQVEFDVTD